jgi:hypothetical protein
MDRITHRCADSGAAAIPGSALQTDLFGTASQTGDEIVAIARTGLHATLALVKAAKAMPWSDQLAIIREDNAFHSARTCFRLPKGRHSGPSSTQR